MKMGGEGVGVEIVGAEGVRRMAGEDAEGRRRCRSGDGRRRC